MRYVADVINTARKLRSKGKTYTEIKKALNLPIPKSTLVSWFRSVILPMNYVKKVRQLNLRHLMKARLINFQKNKERRIYQLEKYQLNNRDLVNNLKDKNVAKVALAMLWLGEGSKKRGVFRLGSSDPRIIKLFLWGIKKCFQFHMTKVRCTLQCRADQNIEALEKYWMDITGVPKNLFYKARIDPRTVGKATMKSEYKGVLRIDYFDVKIQDEIATIVNMLYNQVSLGSEV